MLSIFKAGAGWGDIGDDDTMDDLDLMLLDFLQRWCNVFVISLPASSGCYTATCIPWTQPVLLGPFQMCIPWALLNTHPLVIAALIPMLNYAHPWAPPYIHVHRHTHTLTLAWAHAPLGPGACTLGQGACTPWPRHMHLLVQAHAHATPGPGTCAPWP